MHVLTEDYVSVAEAATLLHVSRSTIRRWIREGDLPAYRIGQRRVALRRTDLATIVASTTGGGEHEGDVAAPTRPLGRRLSPDEQRRGLEALDRAERLSKQILARRGGKPFSPSWEVLDALRDERTRQLSG